MSTIINEHKLLIDAGGPGSGRKSTGARGSDRADAHKEAEAAHVVAAKLKHPNFGTEQAPEYKEAAAKAAELSKTADNMSQKYGTPREKEKSQMTVHSGDAHYQAAAYHAAAAKEARYSN